MPLDQTRCLLLHRKESEARKEGKKGGKSERCGVEPEGDAPENVRVLERHQGRACRLLRGSEGVSAHRYAFCTRGGTRQRKTVPSGREEDGSHRTGEDAEREAAGGFRGRTI